MAMPALKFDGAFEHPCDVVLAHGAGQPMDSPFMDAIVAGLAERGHRICRFEFPYMEAIRADGRKRPPDAAGKLIEAYKDVVRGVGGAAGLVIGGKSMGGRMASLIADEIGARGLVCLGYPFHPAGKPGKLRVEHLAAMQTPTLTVQGTRDALDSADDVAGYGLPKSIRLHWIEDGDHSFKPRKSSGRGEMETWAEATDAVAGFIASLDPAHAAGTA